MLVVVLDSSIVSDIALKWHVGQESHVMMIVDSKPEYGPDMIFASEDEYDRQSVSYTHLTLPTIAIV